MAPDEKVSYMEVKEAVQLRINAGDHLAQTIKANLDGLVFNEAEMGKTLNEQIDKALDELEAEGKIRRINAKIFRPD
jgi:hypothetical protein